MRIFELYATKVEFLVMVLDRVLFIVSETNLVTHFVVHTPGFRLNGKIVFYTSVSETDFAYMEHHSA
jgi:hypothetical protein